jgi:hypothetical protein
VQAGAVAPKWMARRLLCNSSERSRLTSTTTNGCTSTNRPRASAVQPVGCQPDAGGLCAALHRDERAQVLVSRRQHRAGSDRVPGLRSHRRHHHDRLRLSERGVGDRRLHGADVPDRVADRLLRRQVRRGYRSAHARRRFRLPRLDRHLADLRLIHLPAVFDRSQHPVGGVADAVRHCRWRSRT